MFDEIHSRGLSVYKGLECIELFSQQGILNNSWLLFIEKRDEILDLSEQESNQVGDLIVSFLNGDLNDRGRRRDLITLARYKLRFDLAIQNKK